MMGGSRTDQVVAAARFCGSACALVGLSLFGGQRVFVRPSRHRRHRTLRRIFDGRRRGFIHDVNDRGA